MTEAEGILKFINAWFEEHGPPMPMGVFMLCVVQGTESAQEEPWES